MESLKIKLKKTYKGSTKASYRSKIIPDLRLLFTQAELQKSTMENGARVLNETINTTAKEIVLRLRLAPQTAPAGSTTPSPSSAGRDLNDPSSISPSLSAPSTAEAKLNKYIEICKDKANKHGFNLQTEIHQVLANKGITLLKKGQFCSEFVKYIDTEFLLNNIKSDVIYTSYISYH